MEGPIAPPSSPRQPGATTTKAVRYPAHPLRGLVVALALGSRSNAFSPPPSQGRGGRTSPCGPQTHGIRWGDTSVPGRRGEGERSWSSSTELPMVWWFGGTANGERAADDEESCELVAIRIEKTSANSRRIGGEIIVDRPLKDVWAILTDYDNLSTHVPNLVESKQIPGARGSTRQPGGEPGDGSYKCRLYQKGSQNIIGFQFAADVTMDMTESANVDFTNAGLNNEETSLPEERRIGFKCVKSQFFSEFDGEWRAVESPNLDPTIDGAVSTTLSYTVAVRPNGPVPVAALEWRIREDVPTNLRAVKKAAIEVGYDGVTRMRNPKPAESFERSVQLALSNGASEAEPLQSQMGMRRDAAMRTGRQIVDRAATAVTTAAANASVVAQQARAKPKLAPVRVDWFEDETMAAYLEE